MKRDIAYLQYSSQNFKRNVTSYIPTELAQSPKWRFEFTGTNQIPAIYFYIVLNKKNWIYLVVWTIIKQSFTSLGLEDRCSSYSEVPSFLNTDTTDYKIRPCLL